MPEHKKIDSAALAQIFTQAGTAIEFDAMPLAVVETEGFNTAVAFECPREASGGILPARKQY